MTEHEYDKLTLVQMRQRRWRLSYDVTRGDNTVLPAGLEVIITAKHVGLYLQTLTCTLCRHTYSVGPVSSRAVTEIAED